MVAAKLLHKLDWRAYISLVDDLAPNNLYNQESRDRAIKELDELWNTAPEFQELVKIAHAKVKSTSGKIEIGQSVHEGADPLTGKILIDAGDKRKQSYKTHDGNHYPFSVKRTIVHEMVHMTDDVIALRERLHKKEGLFRNEAIKLILNKDKPAQDMRNELYQIASNHRKAYQATLDKVTEPYAMYITNHIMLRHFNEPIRKEYLLVETEPEHLEYRAKIQAATAMQETPTDQFKALPIADANDHGERASFVSRLYDKARANPEGAAESIQNSHPPENADYGDTSHVRRIKDSAVSDGVRNSGVITY